MSTAFLRQLAERQAMGLSMVKLSVELGEQTPCFEAACEAFADVCDQMIMDPDPKGTKTPEVRAFLRAAKSCALKALTTQKAIKDPAKAARTLALAGPAITLAADVLDAMLDEAYVEEA